MREYIKAATPAMTSYRLLYGSNCSLLKTNHNKLNLIITVDMGRANTAQNWQHHSSPKAIKNLPSQTVESTGHSGSIIYMVGGHGDPI